VPAEHREQDLYVGLEVVQDQVPALRKAHPLRGQHGMGTQLDEAQTGEFGHRRGLHLLDNSLQKLKRIE
jgi:hypothetical protein